MTSLRIPLSSISTGARGFLTVSFSVDQDTMLLPGVDFNQHAVKNSALEVLITPAERQVLRLMKKPAKIIANDLNVSVHTIKKHISNLLIKTQCENSKDLASWATIQGFIYE